MFSLTKTYENFVKRLYIVHEPWIVNPKLDIELAELINKIQVASLVIGELSPQTWVPHLQIKPLPVKLRGTLSPCIAWDLLQLEITGGFKKLNFEKTGPSSRILVSTVAKTLGILDIMAPYWRYEMDTQGLVHSVYYRLWVAIRSRPVAI